jgi:DNA-binding SARP family transcriptional activator/predicted ATPase
MLRLSFLGPLKVTVGGAPVTDFGYDKVRALLVYLAVESRRSHSRRVLAGLLWPDYPERAARGNLRNALSRLRRAIRDREAAPPYLLIERDTLQFNPDSDHWLDVAAFRALLEGEGGDGPARQRLEEAVALCRGRFLEGLSLSDSPEFEDWCLVIRERLERDLLDALQRLATHYVQDEDYTTACEYARRAVELAPWQEAAHQQLMRLLAMSGQRSVALAQYESCVRFLEEELGVEPGEETRQLYERIRDEEDQGHPPNLTALRSLPPHNLPAPVAPFVGREELLAEIVERLRGPDCRLLTLTGPGGSGKTRLALEAGRGLVSERSDDRFGDGIFWIPLAPVQSCRSIVPTIAQALGLAIHEGGESKEQLLRYLRRKRMLLILDNLEHLLEGASLVTEILAAAPDLKILVTSRVRLNVRGEHLLPIGGMRYPGDSPQALVAASEHSAVRLFLAGARRLRPGLEPTADELADVARICRLVGGMPLAILLAAAWVGVLSPSEIADEIEQHLDFLASDLHDVPERHRSIVAAFDASWRLLGEAERRAFARLCVFRGGFSREAALAVAEADVQMLKALVDQSFLMRLSSGRYEVHELLRQYGEGKLDAMAGERDKVDSLHCEYYAHLLRRRGTDILDRAKRQEVLHDIDNVRAAWRWAVSHGKVSSISELLEGLGTVHDRQGWFEEGAAEFGWAAESLRARDPAGAAGVALAHVLLWQGWCLRRLGRPDRDPSHEALSLLRQYGGRQDVADGYLLSFYSGGSRESAEARPLVTESLAFYAEVDDLEGMSRAQVILGVLALHGGAYRDAEDRFRRALELTTGRRGEPLLYLARVFYLHGDYEQARQFCGQALRFYEAMDLTRSRAQVLCTVGDTYFATGAYGEAQRHYRQALDLLQKWGYRAPLTARLLGDLVSVALASGDALGAARWYQQAAALAADHERKPLHCCVLVGSAAALVRNGRGTAAHGRAVELLALATQRKPDLQDWERLVMPHKIETLLKDLRASLQADEFAAALDRGQGRDLDATLQELLAELGA